jgi:hypothetical protein
MLTPQNTQKLTQLFTCDVSTRFSILFAAELSSQFIYQINLEGPPLIAANAVADAFRRLHNVSDNQLGPHGQAMQDKFIAYIEAQPIPAFIQEYLDKGNR